MTFPSFSRLLTFSFAMLIGFAAFAQSGHSVLSITTASGTHNFNVDVMQSEADLEKGLMFRKSIPADYGMLFDFKHEQTVMMWMKNTFIPLDMLFMDKTGKVVGVIANAVPMSEKILTIGKPTDAVLELQGGAAARMDLKIGDEVHDPIFTP
jgi:uncharacterized membrane protein (UPF0127 family)